MCCSTGVGTLGADVQDRLDSNGSSLGGRLVDPFPHLRRRHAHPRFAPGWLPHQTAGYVRAAAQETRVQTVGNKLCHLVKESVV